MTMIKRINQLVVMMTVAVTLNSVAQSYDAGKEYDAVLPVSGLHIKLYVPANYTPDHQWPLVLFYHGMNGSPTTDCIARHCEGKDFIIVGMSYCEAEVPQMTRAQHDEYIEKERKNFLETVGFVKANLSLDLERVFLGGLSKGGWTTSFVGEREMERLAGFIILLAGRQRGAVPGPQSMAGFPVYIGVGENDPNLIPGVQAAGFYRHCRADLCYEEFMGLGHQSPDKATRLVQWLEAYGPMSHPWLDAAAKERRKAEYREVYKKVLELKDQSAVCRELRSLLDDPRLLVACGEATVKAIVFQLATLARSDAQAAKALEAERMFYELVWKEWNMKTLEDSQELVDGYSRLAQAGSQTRYDVYAAKSYERLHPMYEAAKKQMGQMKEAQKKAQQKAPARPQMRNSSGTGAMSGF